MSNHNPADGPMLSLSYSDYLHFSELMRDRFGLAFPENRRTELEIGVRRAFAASTCPDLESYYKILLDPLKGGTELERLANYLTIGETHFFRDAGQFDALVNTVLPDLIERRRATRTLRIWSAGCASGEEPFSIAILLYDLLPDIANWNITIMGTDINTQHLERAHRGVYGEWAFRETRARMLRPKYFTQNGNQYELNPVIRKMVRFSQLNLAEDHYPSYETNTMFMDVILCRNVTIYFSESITRVIVERFYNALTEGGWLVIGHSEHSLDTYRRFHSHIFQDAILYQRLAEHNPSDPVQETLFNKPSSIPHPSRPSSQAAVSLPPVLPLNTSLNFVSAPDSGNNSSLVANNQDPSRTSLHNDGDNPPVSQSPMHPAGSYEQALSLLNDGYIDQARDMLAEWLANHPKHAPGYALLGKAYANQGNWPEAKRWCQLAITYDRLNLEAYYTLGLVYQHQGKREQAIEMLKKVVYIDPRDILGHFCLADLFYNNGQTNLAFKSLENTRRLLETHSIDEMVPRSGDITVGRLGQTLIELQQLWGKPAPLVGARNDH